MQYFGHLQVIGSENWFYIYGFKEYLWRVLVWAQLRFHSNDIESVQKVNGGLYAPFRIDRVIRHDCSLSSMLYTLAMKPLLCKIRCKIPGLSRSNCNTLYCVSVYADAAVVLVNEQRYTDV